MRVRPPAPLGPDRCAKASATSPAVRGPLSQVQPWGPVTWRAASAGGRAASTLRYLQRGQIRVRFDHTHAHTPRRKELGRQRLLPEARTGGDPQSQPRARSCPFCGAGAARTAASGRPPCGPVADLRVSGPGGWPPLPPGEPRGRPPPDGAAAGVAEGRPRAEPAVARGGSILENKLQLSRREAAWNPRGRRLRSGRAYAATLRARLTRRVIKMRPRGLRGWREGAWIRTRLPGPAIPILREVLRVSPLGSEFDFSSFKRRVGQTRRSRGSGVVGPIVQTGKPRLRDGRLARVALGAGCLHTRSFPESLGATGPGPASPPAACRLVWSRRLGHSPGGRPRSGRPCSEECGRGPKLRRTWLCGIGPLSGGLAHCDRPRR